MLQSFAAVPVLSSVLLLVALSTDPEAKDTGGSCTSCKLADDSWSATGEGQLK